MLAHQRNWTLVQIVSDCSEVHFINDNYTRSGGSHKHCHGLQDLKFGTADFKFNMRVGRTK